MAVTGAGTEAAAATMVTIVEVMVMVARIVIVKAVVVGLTMGVGSFGVDSRGRSHGSDNDDNL